MLDEDRAILFAFRSAIDDIEIRRAKTKGKAYGLRDGRGLYLWVTSPGGRLWRWKYRYQGKEKLMSFGKYPDVSLALARGPPRRRTENPRLRLGSRLAPSHPRRPKVPPSQGSSTPTNTPAGRWLPSYFNGRQNTTVSVNTGRLIRLPDVFGSHGMSIWRRGRDSNPRYRFGYAGFQDRSHQPLGHLSHYYSFTTVPNFLGGVIGVSPSFCTL